MRHCTTLASSLICKPAADATRATGVALRAATRAPSSTPQVASKLAKAMRPAGSGARSSTVSVATTTVSAVPAGQAMRFTTKRPGSL